jgi:hypothetical protein
VFSSEHLTVTRDLQIAFQVSVVPEVKMLSKIKNMFVAAKEHRGLIGVACGLVGGAAAVTYGSWRTNRCLCFQESEAERV